MSRFWDVGIRAKLEYFVIPKGSASLPRCKPSVEKQISPLRYEMTNKKDVRAVSLLCEALDELLRRDSLAAKSSQGERIVAFGQSFTVVIQHELSMKVSRDWKTEGLLQQDLPGS